MRRDNLQRHEGDSTRYKSFEQKLHNLEVSRDRLLLKRRFETGTDNLVRLQTSLHADRDGGRGRGHGGQRSPELWELALANRPSARSAKLAAEVAADERTARTRRRERRAAEAETARRHEQQLGSMTPKDRRKVGDHVHDEVLNPPAHPSLLNESKNQGLSNLSKSEYQKSNICSKTIVQNLCMNLYGKVPPVYSLITEGRFGCEVEVTHPMQPELKYRGRGAIAKVAEKRAAWEAIKNAATWASLPEAFEPDDDVAADDARGGGMPVLPGPAPAALAARAGTIPPMDKETLLRVLRGFAFLSTVEYDVISKRLGNEKDYLDQLNRGALPWYTHESVAASKEGDLDKLMELDRLIKLRGDVPDMKFVNILMFVAMMENQTERWAVTPGGLPAFLQYVYDETSAQWSESQYTLMIRGLMQAGELDGVQ